MFTLDPEDADAIFADDDGSWDEPGDDELSCWRDEVPELTRDLERLAITIEASGAGWSVTTSPLEPRLFPPTRRGLEAACDLLNEALSGPTRPATQLDLFEHVRSDEEQRKPWLQEILVDELKRSVVRERPGLRRILERAQPYGVAACPLLDSDALAERPELLSDLERFPAAGFVLSELEGELRPRTGLNEDEPLAAARWVEAFAGWRGLLSPRGRPCRSLNRTLAAVSDELAADCLYVLKDLVLERPLSPLSLHAIVERFNASFDGERRRSDLTLLQRAPEDVLRAQIRTVSAAILGVAGDGREEVHLFAELLSESPVDRHRRLDVVVRRSLEWLLAYGGDPLEVLEDGPGPSPQGPVATPPIAPPELDGVTFLSTVNEIILEGRRMHHCVGTRAQDALSGDCFLFHVERVGTRATAEVSRGGAVTEVSGPFNRRTPACDWAEGELREWGRRFPRSST